MLRMRWKCQNRREIYVYEKRSGPFWLLCFFQEKGDIGWTERKLEGSLSAFGQWAWSLVERTLDSEHVRRVKGADKTKIQRHREGCGWNYKAHLRTFITPQIPGYTLHGFVTYLFSKVKIVPLKEYKMHIWFYFNSKLLHDLRPILFSIIFYDIFPSPKGAGSSFQRPDLLITGISHVYWSKLGSTLHLHVSFGLDLHTFRRPNPQAKPSGLTYAGMHEAICNLTCFIATYQSKMWCVYGSNTVSIVFTLSLLRNESYHSHLLK